MPYQVFSYYEVLGNDESGLLVSLHWEFLLKGIFNLCTATGNFTLPLPDFQNKSHVKG